ncbi:hypothetical protein [Pseudomonas sp. Irchel s3h17]|uniref:hypothetical protein n=1 Tax=Pseudomonas sp. Irchel s3h17 TaxID=2009182 RepID=UPI00117A0C0F|nr:hypothetical protein [Pseudomonas sp. Irchel s3h17]
MNTLIQQQLLDAIRTAQAPIAAFMLGITGFSDPNSSLVQRAHTITIRAKSSQKSLTDTNEEINSPNAYHLLINPSLEYIKANPRKIFEFLNIPIKAAILHVGDAFSKVKYLNRAPELEFLRHIRNAIAHGNRFNITSELKLPATFASYIITNSLNGEKLFSDIDGEGYWYDGDALALLDFLESRLLSGDYFNK